MVGINFRETINKLNPVTWIYKNDESRKRYIGYIAEELFEHEELKYVVSVDKNGKPNGIDYGMISVYLVESVKELYAQIDTLNKKITELELKDN